MAVTIVIEDGTASTPSANSYVTVAEVTLFCNDLGLSSWADLDSQEKAQAILRGMAYVESLDFKGVKDDYSNPLEWPRYGVYDDVNAEPEDMQYYQEIPVGLKKAVCRAAYEESVSSGILQTSLTTGIKREKVDVIEVEYQQAPMRSASQTLYPAITGYLKGLLKSSVIGGGSSVVNVLRT
jgi:hypothetical protein